MEANNTFTNNNTNSDLLLAQLDKNNGVNFFTNPTTYINTITNPKTFNIINTTFQTNSLTTPYNYTFNLRIVDINNITYTQLTNPITNTNKTNTTTLTPPIKISKQTQTLDSMNPNYNYYKITLTTNQTLIILTKKNPNTPITNPNNPNNTPKFTNTIIHLLNKNNNNLIINNNLLKNNQSTFNTTNYTTQTNKTITIIIKPYYNKFFNNFSNNHYLLHILIKQ